MKTHHRPFVFESSDFQTLCQYLLRDHERRNGRFLWHIARLVDWKYNLGNPRRRFPDNFGQAAHLWFNAGEELVGFVISEEFDADFQVFTLPNYQYLYQEMLDWVITGWGTQHSKLSTQAVEDQAQWMAVLQKNGFAKTEDLEMTRVFDTTQYAGFSTGPCRLVTLAEYGDYRKQLQLRRSVWPHADDPDFDLMVSEYVRKSPLYNASFDYLLLNAEGEVVSGCEAFVDRHNGTAEIERVCTFPDHWNRGYSKITLQGCFRDLHENGIATAFLSGGYDKTLHLYGSLGHSDEYSRFTYALTMD